MYHQGEEKATAEIEHAFVKLNIEKPVKIPEEILGNLEKLII